jgi:hypothetical protein
MLCLGKSEADVLPKGELGGCNPPGLDRALGGQVGGPEARPGPGGS